LRWFILPPVTLLAMALAIANRQTVTLGLDPFNPASPALGVSMPLALVVIIALFLGILIGGFATWRQARRKAARRGDPLLPPSGNLATLPTPRP
jgi:hypothetical protein